MADTFTTHYNLTKPQIGGDPDTWGTLLNANFDTIDSQLYTASTYALPLTGGTLTGALTLAPSGQPNLRMTAPASGTARTLQGYTGANARWQIELGNASAESGSNVGSDFSIDAFSDSGAALGSPLTIARSSGLVSIGSGGITTTGTVNGQYITATGQIFQGVGAAAVLTNSVNGTLYLRPNANSTTNQATLDTSGNFTAQSLIAAGSVTASTNFLSSNTNWLAAPSAAGTLYFRPNGVGSTTNQSTLGSDGIWHAVDFSASSDARLKTEVRKLRRGIDELKRMLPREYIKADREEVGFIAQEVQEVLPEAVSEGADGFLSLSYGQVLALVASAVLELDRRMTLEGF